MRKIASEAPSEEIFEKFGWGWRRRWQDLLGTRLLAPFGQSGVQDRLPRLLRTSMRVVGAAYVQAEALVRSSSVGTQAAGKPTCER